MVCPRCITAVERIYESLDLSVTNIELGKVSIGKAISTEERVALREHLLAHGFDLIDDKQSKLIHQIKAIIIQEIHHSKEASLVKFSVLLSENLLHDYSYLSRLFSSVEGITIERFIRKQKIEKVKELLFYDELSLSEIAFQLNYSSVAHLSSQFKKETGMTATAFKKLKQPGHKSLDTI